MSNIRSYFYRPKNTTETETPKRWNIPGIIWSAIKKTCTVLGAMILLSALMSTCAVMVANTQGGGNTLPNDMVLVLPIEQNISETQTRPSLYDPFPFMQPTLQTITKTLHRAKTDDRVRGVVFSMKGGSVNISHAEELIDAINDFKESGKFTKIYAPSYADGAGGLVHYMLASAFDEVWMQPVGMVSIAGLNFEMPFAKNALEKVGVSAQFVKREEFKSAMENFTNENMSEQNKEMLVELLNNWSKEMTAT
ncbi:MAG: S49 family peptidase, partial [Pseudomonadota bacterium]